MQNLVTIGRFSELTQLTIKALRLYDKLGLLRPAVVDFQSGYRYYGLDQITTAERIRLLRSLEMPLEDIHALLNVHDPDAAQQHLARHRQRLEALIVGYQQALTRLHTLDEQHETTKEGQPMEYLRFCCSFCGKGQALVRRFITGPGGIHICNECVWTSNESAIEGQPVRCSLCGADNGRAHRARLGMDEIGICAECLSLCQEIAGEEITTFCSFCGKGQHEARQLVAGSHDVFICNECVTAGGENVTRQESSRCSFCDKSHSEASTAHYARTGSHDSNICDECITLCKKIIEAEEATPA